MSNTTNDQNLSQTPMNIKMKIYYSVLVGSFLMSLILLGLDLYRCLKSESDSVDFNSRTIIACLIFSIVIIVSPFSRKKKDEALQNIGIYFFLTFLFVVLLFLVFSFYYNHPTSSGWGLELLYSVLGILCASYVVYIFISMIKGAVFLIEKFKRSVFPKRFEDSTSAIQHVADSIEAFVAAIAALGTSLLGIYGLISNFIK